MRIDNYIETKANKPSCLIVSEEFLGVLDSKSNIHFIKNSAVVCLQKFDSPAPHPYYKANRASGDGKKLCLWIEGRKAHFVFDYEQSKKGYTAPTMIDWDLSSPATAASFSSTGLLLAMGNEKGEAVLFHTRSGKMILSLAKCADAVLAIEFDKTNTILAYSSFSKDLNIFDLNKNALASRYTHKKDGDITAIKPLSSKTKVVFATTAGDIAVYNYALREVFYFEKKLNAPISDLFLDEDEKFVLISDEDGKLYIAGFKDSDLEFLGDLESNIIDITIKNGTVIALLANGNIAEFDHKKYLLLLSDLMRNRDIKAVVALGKNYPPIRHSLVYRDLDLLFENDLRKAQDLVANRELSKAKDLLEPYYLEPRYKMQIGSFELSVSKIRALADVISSDRIEQAYAMAQTNELYRSLSIYKKLESTFGLKLRGAVLMLTGKKTDPIAARRAVEVYSKVATKSKIIQAVFDMPLLFKTASDMIKKGEYEGFKQLSQKYPILKETPCNLHYEESAKEATKLFFTLYRSGQMQDAIAKSEEINRLYTSYYPQIIDFVSKAKIARSFEEAIENSNYQSALAYSLRNSFLQAHPKYYQVIHHYNQIFLTAINYAINQKFDAMNSLIFPMLKIKIFRERVVLIYNIYYLYELEKLNLNENQKELAVKYLIESFGLSKMLLNICQKIGAEKFINIYKDSASNEFVNRPIVPSLKVIVDS